jgi:malonyl-CoA O-methyltransferase
MDRFNTKQVQKSFNKGAAHYDLHAELQQDVLRDGIELAGECWKPDAHILDLGCGTGTFAQHTHYNTCNLDISFAMCAQAHAKHANTIQASSASLPFADCVFDGVFSSLMLQWSNDPKRVFDETIRVLKPGGRAIISTFIYGTLKELRESFAALDHHTHINDFGPPNFYSALAVHTGFKLLSAEEQLITEYYPSVRELMRGLKAIGASTKQSGVMQKGLMTPRKLAQLEQQYRKHHIHVDGLPASWNILIMLLEKPE